MSELGRYLCTANRRHQGATLSGMVAVCAECYHPVEWVSYANLPRGTGQ